MPKPKADDKSMGDLRNTSCSIKKKTRTPDKEKERKKDEKIGKAPKNCCKKLSKIYSKICRFGGLCPLQR